MELVIFVGLPGAGKTTFFRERFAATHAHVSKDLLRNNRNPGRRQLTLIEEALRAGRPVVVDNTNAGRDERRPLIALAKGLGAEVVGYHFDATLEDCRERNRGRAGRVRVPRRQIEF
jgi:predicted kinase